MTLPVFADFDSDAEDFDSDYGGISALILHVNDGFIDFDYNEQYTCFFCPVWWWCCGISSQAAYSTFLLSWYLPPSRLF